MSDDHEEMPNYCDMQGGDMLKALGDNGQLWAQAFIQIIDRIGRDKIDEGFMIGWFANAIEHSNAVRRWAREAAPELADARGEVSGQAPDLSRTPPALAHGEALARIVRLEAALRFYRWQEPTGASWREAGRVAAVALADAPEARRADTP